MFHFKKKSTQDEFVAPVSGIILDLSEVKDDAFSSKQLGEGFAIAFDGEDVYAPCDGNIVACFPTGHALGIVTPKGKEVLLHIGIDTVNLKGEGFTPLIEVGQTVKQGDKLLQVSSSFLKEKGYDATTMVIFTDGTNINIKKLHQRVEAKEQGVIVVC